MYLRPIVVILLLVGGDTRNPSDSMCLLLFNVVMAWMITRVATNVTRRGLLHCGTERLLREEGLVRAELQKERDGGDSPCYD